MSDHCLYVVLEFLIKATMQSAKGVYGKLRIPEQPRSARTALFL